MHLRDSEFVAIMFMKSLVAKEMEISHSLIHAREKQVFTGLKSGTWDEASERAGSRLAGLPRARGCFWKPSCPLLDSRGGPVGPCESQGEPLRVIFREGRWPWVGCRRAGAEQLWGWPCSLRAPQAWPGSGRGRALPWLQRECQALKDAGAVLQYFLQGLW